MNISHNNLVLQLVKMRSQTVQTTEGRRVRGVMYHGPKRTASFIVTSVILIARVSKRAIYFHQIYLKNRTKQITI